MPAMRSPRWRSCDRGARDPWLIGPIGPAEAGPCVRALRTSTQVARDDFRGVRARAAGDAAARMRAGAAQIQPSDWRRVLRPAEHGPHRVELIERVLALEDVAAGEPVLPFEVQRSEHLASEDRARNSRRVLLERLHHEVA